MIRRAVIAGLLATAPIVASSASLQALQEMEAAKPAKASANLTGARLQAVRETALAYAMQMALSEETISINGDLESMAGELNATFNFDRVIVDRMLLPPVLTQQSGLLRVADDATARAVGESYRIEYPARIVASAPTWRDFLVRSFAPPRDPSPLALPRDDVERAAWKQAVSEGWEKGKAQAKANFSNNLALLTRVFKGMVTYTVLAKEGVVSTPRLSASQRGVTYAEAGREMNVGDTIYRVSESGRFEQARKWTFVPPNAGSPQ